MRYIQLTIAISCVLVNEVILFPTKDGNLLQVKVNAMGEHAFGNQIYTQKGTCSVNFLGAPNIGHWYNLISCLVL